MAQITSEQSGKAVHVFSEIFLSDKSANKNFRTKNAAPHFALTVYLFVAMIFACRADGVNKLPN